MFKHVVTQEAERQVTHAEKQDAVRDETFFLTDSP
jgi:hypothetical protein